MPCIILCTVLTVAWHIFFSHLDATNEAVYELVAEPTQEQQAGEPQAEAAVEPVPEEDANPADLQGKPRSITLLVFNVYLSICAFTFIRVV